MSFDPTRPGAIAAADAITTVVGLLTLIRSHGDTPADRASPACAVDCIRYVRATDPATLQRALVAATMSLLAHAELVVDLARDHPDLFDAGPSTVDEWVQTMIRAAYR